jgi:hypothetical protein
MSVPSEMAARTIAKNTPNTRATRSGGTARCSAMTAPTSTTSVPAPRAICRAKARAGLWTTASRAVGRQQTSTPAQMTTARRREAARRSTATAMRTPPMPRPGQQVAEALGTGAELVLRDADEQDAVGAVDEAHQRAERDGHARGRQLGDRARTDQHLREGPRLPLIGHVDRLAARAHARHDERRDGVAGGIDREHRRRRAEREQSRADRRPRDDDEVLDRAVQRVGRREVVLAGDLRDHRGDRRVARARGARPRPRRSR